MYHVKVKGQYTDEFIGALLHDFLCCLITSIGPKLCQIRRKVTLLFCRMQYQRTDQLYRKPVALYSPALLHSQGRPISVGISLCVLYNSSDYLQGVILLVLRS